MSREFPESSCGHGSLVHPASDNTKGNAVIFWSKWKRLERVLKHTEEEGNVTSIRKSEPMKDPRSLHLLLESLADVRVAVRRPAVYTVGKLKIRDARFVEPLISALGSRNPDLRAVAAWALGERETCDERAVSALMHALDDNDSLVRMRAKVALKRIEGIRYMDSLATALGKAATSGPTPPADLTDEAESRNTTDGVESPLPESETDRLDGNEHSISPLASHHPDENRRKKVRTVLRPTDAYKQTTPVRKKIRTVPPEATSPPPYDQAGS